MNVRYPIWLRTAQQRPGANAFALLFALESIARGLLSTVITLQALHLLASVRDVSLLFSAVGVVGLIASFSIPTLVRVLRRRWVYTIGAALIFTSAMVLATLTVSGQVIGMLARVYGTACLNITLSLFILQFIRRSELTVSEPKRLQFSAIAWTVGPALGVVLYQHVGPLAPYALSAIAATLLIVFFWILKFRDSETVQPADRKPPSPWRSIGRFVAQPRMRLAWFVVFTRASWWVFFYIYTAAYAVQTGLGEVAGAMVISAGNAILFIAPVIGRRAERFGVRAVLIVGIAVAGCATVLAGFFQESPAVVIGMLLVGALGVVALDSVGNIPFFAAVRPNERGEMTTVFRTYIDASELLPPAVFALILTFADLSAVFVAQGVFMLLAIYWVRHVPARLGRRRIVLKVPAVPAEAVVDSAGVG